MIDLAALSYVKSDEDGLWRPNAPRSDFGYSDGPEEQAVRQAIVDATDRSTFSRDLAGRISSWVTRYHLSPARSGLLRPVAALIGGEVLEIGAGFGAITRALGEAGHSVTAFEGSPFRAATAALRCRDLPNVQVACDDVAKLPGVASFDTVIMVGVLEYARMYFGVDGPGDPVDRMLDRIASLLKSGGRLVLAIENQLGLKYFAGYAEDHLGQRFAGIEDRYTADGPVTFGRRELAARLDGAGLGERQWLYPFPDYKLPAVVLTEQATQAGSAFNTASLIAQAVRRDVQRPAEPLFSTGSAWRPLVRNGLAPDLAHSFLIVASREPVPPSDTIAYYLALDRPVPHGKAVRFVRSGDGVVAETEATDGTHVSTDTYRQGTLWHDRLADLVLRPGWTFEDLSQWTATWWDAVKAALQASGIEPSGLATGSSLPSGFIDAIPRNLIIGEDGTHFIDQEWSLASTIEAGYLFHRAVRDAFLTLDTCNAPAPGVPLSIDEIAMRLSFELGLWMTRPDVLRYKDFERQFQAHVAGMSPSADEIAFGDEHIPIRPLLEDTQQLEGRLAEFRQHAANLEEKVTDLESDFVNARRQHANALAGLEDEKEVLRLQGDELRHEAEILKTELAKVSQSLQNVLVEVETSRATSQSTRRQDRERYIERSATLNRKLVRAQNDLRQALEELDISRANNEALHLQSERMTLEAQKLLDRIRAESNDHAMQAQALRGSTFWRMTAPLRIIANRVPSRIRPGQKRRPLSILPTDGHGDMLPAKMLEIPVSGEAVQSAPPAETISTTLSVTQPPETPQWPITLPDLFILRNLHPRGRIAVVIHVFYPEVCDELLDAAQHITEPFDLFVTLVEGQSDHLLQEVRERFMHAYVWVFPNRGRDIMPFMALASTGALFRYELICKLHSKRSPHLEDGDVWRRHLVSSILPDREGTAEIVAAFDADPDLGLTVADGQVFEGPEFWEGNLVHLHNLLPLLGRTVEQALTMRFAGGSIFWLRASILRDLVGLDLNPEAYEPEPIGVDGSLAHVLERFFSIACYSGGFQIAQASRVRATITKQNLTALKQETPRVVAFYLPQFHPIPQNDMWWGRGFTEWTNVTKAKPLFAGHRQPRLPGELGFADLRLPETRAAQARLAQDYGVSAFCYYYYWFGMGDRLLHRPLDEVLASGEPDLPFMICWANEPWSRNWDGAHKEVLMPQEYPEGWTSSFARDVAPLLHDPRYVRLGGPEGPPMLMIYRIMHIPDAAKAIAMLRSSLRDHGIEHVHISAGWVFFEDDEVMPSDPAVLGLDSFFEFPPHRINAVPASQDVKPKEMTGGLYEYAPTVDAALHGQTIDSERDDRHPAVMMGWDNTARRGTAAHVFRGATPGHFRRWLRGIVQHQRSLQHAEERLIFVNAWNEWAEGTCLEPDRDFDRGWLEAVRSALK